MKFYQSLNLSKYNPFANDKRISKEVKRAFEELSKQYFETTYPQERENLINQFQTQFPNQFKIDHSFEDSSWGQCCLVNLSDLNGNLLKTCYSNYRNDFDDFDSRPPSPKPEPIPYKLPRQEFAAELSKVEQDLLKFSSLFFKSTYVALFSLVWMIYRKDEFTCPTVDRSVMAIGTGAVATLGLCLYQMNALERKQNGLISEQSDLSISNHIIENRNQKRMQDWEIKENTKKFKKDKLLRQIVNFE